MVDQLCHIVHEMLHFSTDLINIICRRDVGWWLLVGGRVVPCGDDELHFTSIYVIQPGLDFFHVSVGTLLVSKNVSIC